MIRNIEQHVCDFCGSICTSYDDCRLPTIKENGYVVCEERDVCDSCKEKLAKVSRLMTICDFDVDDVEKKLFDDFTKMTTEIERSTGKKPICAMSKERMNIINSFDKTAISKGEK